MTGKIKTNKILHSNHEQYHDLSLIRQLVADAERFQNDPDKFAQLLSEDAHLVNVAGYRVDGRNEIYNLMSAAAKTSLADIITRHELLEIKLIKDDVALAKCIKYIYIKEGNRLKEDSRAVLTFLMIKNNGTWQIASAQNTLIAEKAIRNINEQSVQQAGLHLTDLKNLKN